MSIRMVVRRTAVALAVLAASATAAQAQTLSNIGNVNLNAVAAQTLTVAVTSGSTVNFALAQGGAAAGDVPSAISTSWNLNPGLTGAVSLFGYFDTPSAALTDGTYDIASTYVEGRMTTGAVATFTAFTQTNAVGPANGSLLLFTENITGVNKIGTRNDNLDLQINLTASPTVPASTYVGVLRIQARAL
ncbi:MAG TPA: hypothetical protein VLT84_01870 [Acidobacteriota bacterium]|nr:hypothetical protein [Acidobacteriota bacterium]